MARRGRPPKNPQPVDDFGEATYAAEAPAEAALPAKIIDGKANPAYFREKWARLNARCENHYQLNNEYPKGMDTAVRALEHEAKLSGIDMSTLHDARSDVDKAADLVQQLIDAPETLFEATDGQLSALENALDQADKYVHEHIESVMMEAERQHRDASAPDTRPKALAAGGASFSGSGSSGTEPEAASPSTESVESP
jgi:hypothetical protein